MTIFSLNNRMFIYMVWTWEIVHSAFLILKNVKQIKVFEK